MNALKRNERITITYYPTNEIFNISEIKNDTDIILLAENGITGDICMPNEIKNIELNSPKIEQQIVNWTSLISTFVPTSFNLT